MSRGIFGFLLRISWISNVIADKLSRQFDDSLEWKLAVQVFRELCDRLGTPEVDLFATRLNTQLNRFVAWRPDPEAEAVDAFACSGKDGLLYAFFPLLPHRGMCAEDSVG